MRALVLEAELNVSENQPISAQLQTAPELRAYEAKLRARHQDGAHVRGQR